MKTEKKVSDIIVDSRKQKEFYDSPRITATANLKDITLGGGQDGPPPSDECPKNPPSNLSW